MEIRLINNLEVNKEIHLLPNGVYGYIYGFSFSNIGRENDFTKLKFHKRQPDGFEKQNLFFEVRKLSSSDIKLIGYVSDEAQLTFAQQKEFPSTETLVLPHPYGIFKNQIEVQLFGTTLLIQEREIEDDRGQKISALEVRKCIQKTQIPRGSGKNTDT